jgi:5-methylcytosine-specific restriction endonuclease McrA
VFASDGGCYGALQVHHLTAVVDGGSHDLANLVTTCRGHHEQLEAEARRRRRERLKAERGFF